MFTVAWVKYDKRLIKPMQQVMRGAVLNFIDSYERPQGTNTLEKLFVQGIQ